MRKIIQIAPNTDADGGLWLLCDDGSLWLRNYNQDKFKYESWEININKIKTSRMRNRVESEDE